MTRPSNNGQRLVFGIALLALPSPARAGDTNASSTCSGDKNDDASSYATDEAAATTGVNVPTAVSLEMSSAASDVPEATHFDPIQDRAIRKTVTVTETVTAKPVYTSRTITETQTLPNAEFCDEARSKLAHPDIPADVRSGLIEMACVSATPTAESTSTSVSTTTANSGAGAARPRFW